MTAAARRVRRGLGARRSCAGVLAIALAVLFTGGPADAATVLIKNAWLKSHKNRVTVTANCRFEKSHQSPNGIGDDGKDGDLHMACRCTGVGLPMVAEIVNAARFPAAVSAARTGADGKITARLTGVWRLWLEHPAKKTQTQGAAVPAPTNTNPAHVFEIHPLTGIAGEDLAASFADVPGYSPYSAQTAFKDYEARELTVGRKAGYTSIKGTKARYNYAGFRFTLYGKPKKVADGWIALATIDGVVADPRRMVFAQGTPPGTLIAGAKKGDRFEALGVPRIDLDKIDAAIADGMTVVPAAYEMIIVALAKK